MAWWIWVLLGILALAGESVSMALFLLYVGIAAFAAAVLALLGAGSVVQLGIFLALAVSLIGLVRPRMLQAWVGRVPHRALTNQGLAPDRVATAVQDITEDSGTIRVGNAEFWSARAVPPTQRIAAGTTVRVVYVNGLTAYVDVLPVMRETPPAAGEPDRAEKLRK
jgi:membrane protein implicated in regulation of membrane protease activity